ncbi:MAG TPA: PHP domain-containing protein [Clostridia bacterium]|nr:PHP domain-containing protein [Clostridia bacterium]
MEDVHVHFLHNTTGKYTFELLDKIVSAAVNSKMDEIYLLEHTHQFSEFRKVYEPVDNFNLYQHDWLTTRMGGTIENYLSFIESAKKKKYDLKIKFGLEVCFIPKTADLLDSILKEYKFDFLTGSVHYIDGWGFDHKAEFWKDINADNAYRRYYEIMAELIKTEIFDGVAHPDSIKCFQYYPSYNLRDTYIEIANLLNKSKMYAEQSGGLALNYGLSELGLNKIMLEVFKENDVKIRTASDAHKPEHVGANIFELQQLIED